MSSLLWKEDIALLKKNPVTILVSEVGVEPGTSEERKSTDVYQ